MTSGELPYLWGETSLSLESESVRLLGGSNSIRNAELSEDRRDVVIHGFRRYDQPPGDVDVAQALPEEDKHLELTARQTGRIALSA